MAKDIRRTNLRRDTSGNVMYMTAGLLIPLMATIGAGIDLGQAYMAKARLQQACDAGVLAGRRAMGDGSYGSDARLAAERMFEFNYPDDIYNSEGVDFSATQLNASELRGRAEAEVNTIIMDMFGKESFDLEVECTAKLEIANTDIMFVLDTTGSMTTVNPGDTVNRMQALRDEVMAFYDTVTNAQSGTNQIRFGVVPYSSNVNVGRILLAENRNWMSNLVELPSREPNFQMVRPPDQTTYGAAYEENQTYGNWANTSTYYTGYSQTACENIAPPSPTGNTSTSGSTVTVTGSTVDQNGNTVTTYEERQNFRRTVYRYSYVSASRRCYRQSRINNYTRVRPFTVTQFPPQEQFHDYTYKVRTLNAAPLLNGNAMTTDTGPNGTDVDAVWNGCIMERDTIDFDDGIIPPADALDLDIDLVPNGDERTQWKVYLPNIAYPQSWNPWDFQDPSPETTSNDYNEYSTGSVVAAGWAACPSQAMRLRTIPRSDRSVLQNYVNGLIAVGGTYHDVGMVWGARFMSPSGIFAADNSSAPNGAPISRHIVFMTDGQMAPNPGIYGFQGQEYTMQRVGSSNTTELTARHNVRFQTACNAAKSRNITVWVVSFGTALNAQMQQCASGNNAFQANNKDELHARFQQIAAQITRLRLSQ